MSNEKKTEFKKASKIKGLERKLKEREKVNIYALVMREVAGSIPAVSFKPETLEN